MLINMAQRSARFLAETKEERDAVASRSHNVSNNAGKRRRGRARSTKPLPPVCVPGAISPQSGAENAESTESAEED